MGLQAPSTHELPARYRTRLPPRTHELPMRSQCGDARCRIRLPPRTHELPMRSQCSSSLLHSLVASHSRAADAKPVQRLAIALAYRLALTGWRCEASAAARYRIRLSGRLALPVQLAVALACRLALTSCRCEASAAARCCIGLPQLAIAFACRLAVAFACRLGTAASHCQCSSLSH